MSRQHIVLAGRIVFINKSYIHQHNSIKLAATVELLCVYKNDFDLVLKSTLKSKWDQINAALQRYEYFKTWSKIQVKKAAFATLYLYLGKSEKINK